MPTYGYRCNTCGIEFERFQKMSDPPVTDCECGAKGSVKKLIFPVGIQFKGSGFYVNDYTKAGKAEANEKAAASKTDTSKTDTSKTESATPAASTTESGTPAIPATTTESKPAATSAPATKTASE